MKKIISFLLILAITLVDVRAQIGRLDLSPLQKVEQNIGLTDITLEYSRPSKRGREIFGGLVPYHALWRTGANRNTTIQFSRDVIIKGQRVEEGKYAIFSIPTPKDWEVLLYKDTDNWNVPEIIDSSKIVVSVKVPSIQLDKDVEALSISIGDFTYYTFDLIVQWSKTSVTLPIELTTKEIMDTRIANILEGPSYNDYYAAAVYQMESGKEYTKGLNWIEKAIEVTEQVTWWDLRVQAKLLLELGRHEEALKVAKKGLILAQKEKRQYGINEFNGVIKRVKK